jgi:hypothetical protein
MSSDLFTGADLRKLHKHKNTNPDIVASQVKMSKDSVLSSTFFNSALIIALFLAALDRIKLDPLTIKQHPIINA